MKLGQGESKWDKNGKIKGNIYIYIYVYIYMYIYII